MKHRISILAVLLLVLCVNVSKAQLYEVSLDQKLQNSTLIIEGKVIKSEAFRGNDGHIYTAHDIQAFGILKGGLQDLQNQKVTVITYGGTLDEEVETWTHLLTLSKNDVGILFLTATNRPIPNDNKVFYEVYSSSQGFLRYTENDFQEVVAIAPFNYHQKNDLLQNIRQSTGQFTPVFAGGDGSPEDVTGVEYSIKNVSLSGNVLDFDIYVEGLWGSYDLTESELLIEYDPTVLGQNVQSNGVLSISPGVVSNSPNYSLSVNDVNPDRVSVNVKALNTGFTLYTVSNVAEQLVHVQIVSPASGNPDIEFDEAAMQQLSEYLNTNNGVEVFQQVFAVGSIQDISGGSAAGPNISSFYPDTVAAGVLDLSYNDNPLEGTITILGSDFGTLGIDFTISELGDDYRVEFRHAQVGNVGTWISPIAKNDYLKWVDDTIIVRVPTLGEFSNNGLSSNNNYAGTGPIKVIAGKKFGITQTDISSNDLYVKYAVSTAKNPFSFAPVEASVKIKLMDYYLGGQAFYFDSTVTDTNTIRAVEWAMSEWRCASGINIQLYKESDLDSTSKVYACKIRMEALGIVSSGTSATGAYVLPDFPNPSFCIDTDTLIAYTKFKFKELVINSDINWYYGSSTSITLNSGQLDMKSVLLHEFGHVHHLLHSNDPNDLMYYNPNSQGDFYRTITSNALLGGLHSTNFGATSIPILNCSHSNMIPIPSDSCFLDFTSYTKSRISLNEFNIHIFPNPSNYSLNINFKNKTFDGVLYISNSLGQVIETHQIENYTEFEVRVFHLPKGIYGLSFVDTSGEIQSAKFLKY